jgi:hypothetical protein
MEIQIADMRVRRDIDGRGLGDLARIGIEGDRIGFLGPHPSGMHGDVSAPRRDYLEIIAAGREIKDFEFAEVVGLPPQAVAPSRLRPDS